MKRDLADSIKLCKFYFTRTSTRVSVRWLNLWLFRHATFLSQSLSRLSIVKKALNFKYWVETKVRSVFIA